MNVPVIIPALRPEQPLISLVEHLAASGVSAIVIVDDGSGLASQRIFDECANLLKVKILRHFKNLGKGAALKTGFRHVLESMPGATGVVTADADGQHHLDDILAVARSLEKHLGNLVLGARRFDRNVPVRSRIGNVLTRSLARFVLGHSLQDTQTGLRGIPASLLPVLVQLRSNGYEFELDMLIAAKHHRCPIREESIRTIYAPGNPTSHFDPLRDSMKISFVLFRFSALSMLTAVVDNVTFYIAFGHIPGILASQALGRLVAVLFNYGLARRAVFLSQERHRTTFPRYILLVICSGAASYGIIRLLVHSFHIHPMLAKLAAESVLFFANFVLQRDFVFTRPRGAVTALSTEQPTTPEVACQ